MKAANRMGGVEYYLLSFNPLSGGGVTCSKLVSCILDKNKLLAKRFKWCKNALNKAVREEQGESRSDTGEDEEDWEGADVETDDEHPVVKKRGQRFCALSIQQHPRVRVVCC